jgi:hypothetical protein
MPEEKMDIISEKVKRWFDSNDIEEKISSAINEHLVYNRYKHTISFTKKPWLFDMLFGLKGSWKYFV